MVLIISKGLKLILISMVGLYDLAEEIRGLGKLESVD
jgi:hypothetical protein